MLAYSHPQLEDEHDFSQYIHTSPKMDTLVLPPSTPLSARLMMRQDSDYDFTNTSPPSPAGSLSSYSMTASASSSSITSMASNASSVPSFIDTAGMPNTFPYNMVRSASSPAKLPLRPGNTAQSPHLLVNQPLRTPPRKLSTPHLVAPYTVPAASSNLNVTGSPATQSKKSAKRQRTLSDDTQASQLQEMASPSKKPTPSSPEKRGSGKDGADVWPEDVEAAFMDALRVIPKLGRRKVLINGKPCGRNELIAEYICRKTLKTRTRKQVSSHIQVLKNNRRNDPEFMNLVTESMDDADSFTAALMQAGFGGMIQTLPFIKTDLPPLLCTTNFSSDNTLTSGGLAASPMGLGASAGSDGLLSPYTPTFLTRESSYIPSPLVSPNYVGDDYTYAQAQAESMAQALFEQYQNGGQMEFATEEDYFMAATPGSKLSNQLKGMAFDYRPAPIKLPPPAQAAAAFEAQQAEEALLENGEAGTPELVTADPGAPEPMFQGITDEEASQFLNIVDDMLDMSSHIS